MSHHNEEPEAYLQFVERSLMAGKNPAGEWRETACEWMRRTKVYVPCPHEEVNSLGFCKACGEEVPSQSAK